MAARERLITCLIMFWFIFFRFFPGASSSHRSNVIAVTSTGCKLPYTCDLYFFIALLLSSTSLSFVMNLDHVSVPHSKYSYTSGQNVNNESGEREKDYMKQVTSRTCKPCCLTHCREAPFPFLISLRSALLLGFRISRRAD